MNSKAKTPFWRLLRQLLRIRTWIETHASHQPPLRGVLLCVFKLFAHYANNCIQQRCDCIWERFLDLLGALGGFLAVCWGGLGAALGARGRSWGSLGHVLGGLGATFRAVHFSIEFWTDSGRQKGGKREAFWDPKSGQNQSQNVLKIKAIFDSQKMTLQDRLGVVLGRFRLILEGILGSKIVLRY